MSPTNPFRHPARRRQYDSVVAAYHERRKLLFADGRPYRGNSFACAFWAGYDGLTGGLWGFRTAQERAGGNYVFYRAGRDLRAAEDAAEAACATSRD